MAVLRAEARSGQKISALFLLLTMTKLVWSSEAHVDSKIVYSTPLITSEGSDYGPGIEGTAVDEHGNVYATAYGGGTTNGLGLIANKYGDADQEYFIVDQTGSMSFNGIRFLPVSPELSQQFGSRAIATDVRGHQVVQVLFWTKSLRAMASEFCGNDSMAQPNDMAVATRSGRIYLSGGKYGKLTTEVGDGDLWICDTGSSFYSSKLNNLGPFTATRLGLFGLTNGVEISPDEKILYLSETFQTNGVVVENKVWRFDIDQATGNVFNKTLFVDFQQLDGTGWLYIDGMRVDNDGNLFVVRNGPEGEVVKFSPSGKLLLRIKALNMKETTNIDLAGPYGKTLFIVGKCKDDPIKGCVNVWHSNPSPGRAWAEFAAFYNKSGSEFP